VCVLVVLMGLAEGVIVDGMEAGRLVVMLVEVHCWNLEYLLSTRSFLD